MGSWHSFPLNGEKYTRRPIVLLTATKRATVDSGPPYDSQSLFRKPLAPWGRGGWGEGDTPAKPAVPSPLGGEGGFWNRLSAAHCSFYPLTVQWRTNSRCDYRHLL